MDPRKTMARKGSEGPKTTRATSNSPRMAAKRRATARAQARTRQQMARKPSQITEAGVGNIPMTVIRAATALSSRFAPMTTARGATSASSRAATTRATSKLSGASTRGVSKVTGGAVKSGKPVKYGPKNKKLTPQQKSAQTRAMNKARAKYAAEGPKKSASGKKPSSMVSRGNKIIGGSVAGSVAAAGGAVAIARRKKSPTRGASSSRGVWNGTRWVKQ